MYCFPRAISYLEKGKINIKGMVSVSDTRPTTDLLTLFQVTDIYTLDKFQEALDKLASRSAVKIALKPF